MATLALSLAGQVVGGAVGGPIGATIGRALGALAGNAIDSSLFGDKPHPAGSDVRVQGSSEGVPIPRLYGWDRLSGNIIWATQLEQLGGSSSGSKGTQGASDPGIAANFAVAFCEGEVARLGRVWADGNPLDTSGLTMRFYRGTETQTADSLIEAKQTDAPAYRGLCYIVFERLPLAPFGNRIPNISVELCRVVGDLEPAITSVTVIPGATEFGYDPSPRVQLLGRGVTAPETTHQSATVSDWTLSIDELTALCPNLTNVSLVVAWFGNDLRCGSCTIEPKVEASDRTIKGTSWSVAGIDRGSAEVVTTHDGGPAYGGTPSDNSVLAAIADLKARGLRVTLYPIVLMDIAEGNPLGQPAYPWRGRIACLPASQGTSAATTEVAAFTTAYRNFILHYAQLAVDAGGVDAILLGSEMRGMTTTQGPANSFPFVDALVTLAADVRALVGSGCKITYGADWSEYSGVQGWGGAKLFHLDPLWASTNVDAIGIDNYMPMADWRDGAEGPDAAGWDGPYAEDYLKANIAGGEGFDWYYASDADRLAGTRTPITDGAYSEPWVWRFKDLVSWWSNAHHDRPAGVRSASPTAWTAKLKPIWFTELGCGAVDKGANQPNIFVDPKSSESGAPYFSTGAADPLAQRQVLRAALGYWSDPANNPSDGHGGSMVERISLWTWDARPYPAFPNDLDVWSDGTNYPTGHWLNGRLGALATDELIGAIGRDCGAQFGDVDAVPPLVRGYALSGPGTVRDALAPLLSASGLDIHDGADGLSVTAARARLSIVIDDVVGDDTPMISRRRPDPGEAIGALALSYADRERDYLTGSVTAIAAAAGQLSTVATDFVLDVGDARIAAEHALLDATAERDTLSFVAPPSLLALEAGDTVTIDGDVFEITQLRDGPSRQVTAQQVAPSVAATVAASRPSAGAIGPPAAADPLIEIAHLPPSTEDVSHSRLAIAAFAQPWPGSIGVVEDDSGAKVTTLSGAASLGQLTTALATGGIYLWDDRNTIGVLLDNGHLSSLDDDDVLAGGNRIAIQNDVGDWEVIGFGTSVLTAPGAYTLSHLLRGQMGTDFAIGPASPGNDVVVLDGSEAEVPVPPDWLGIAVDLRSCAGASDTTGEVSELDLGLGPVLPLAPVHLTATRAAGSSDIALSWVRRSRADTDSWTPDDAPLDQSPEGYRLSIYNGLTLVRTMTLTAPSATYTTAQQTADFGSPPSSFTYTVAQTSPLYGPGHTSSATFPH